MNNPDLKRPTAAVMQSVALYSNSTAECPSQIPFVEIFLKSVESALAALIGIHDLGGPKRSMSA
jgi:hypothetical protein